MSEESGRSTTDTDGNRVRRGLTFAETTWFEAYLEERAKGSRRSQADRRRWLELAVRFENALIEAAAYDYAMRD